MFKTNEIITVTPDPLRMKQFTELHTKTYGQLAKRDVIDTSGEYLLLIDNDGKPIARASYHVSTELHGTQGPTGIIGHYESPFDDSGIQLLEHSINHFQKFGCEQIVGPMNTSTWHDYRLITECLSDDLGLPTDLFFGERPNIMSYSSHFRDAGFHTCEITESRITTFLTHRSKEARILEEKATAEGFRIETIDMGQFNKELYSIYDLCIEAFTQNPYYVEITRKQFLQLYEGIEKIIDPDLVIIIKDSSEQCVGFAFTIPDIYNPSRLIFKTIAVSGLLRGKGLGLLLFDKIHLKAAEKGYDAVIHAFMHIDNQSRKLSVEEYRSTPYHRYELFEYIPK